MDTLLNTAEAHAYATFLNMTHDEMSAVAWGAWIVETSVPSLEVTGRYVRHSIDGNLRVIVAPVDPWDDTFTLMVSANAECWPMGEAWVTVATDYYVGTPELAKSAAMECLYLY